MEFINNLYMPTLKFKTNINCGGCVSAVTPHLNTTDGVVRWSVDTANPEKILTVEADHCDAQHVLKALQKAGFKAEAIN
jgi:copper chaperone